MEVLRLSRAAGRLGVHPVALRLRAGSGKIPVARAGRERRFSFDDIDVTREDRLARFGAGWLRRPPAVHGATVEVLRRKAQGGLEELPRAFISLVTAFAGGLYGMRSAAAGKWLLAESDRCPPGVVR